jgi:hypothetical protein
MKHWKRWLLLVAKILMTSYLLLHEANRLVEQLRQVL